MKTYTVEMHETLVSWVDVEAESEEAAKKLVAADLENHFNDRHSEYSNGIKVTDASPLD